MTSAPEQIVSASLARRVGRAARLFLCAALLAGPAVALAQDAPATRPSAAEGAGLPLDRIAAVVGTQIILVSDLEAALAASAEQPPTDPAEREKMMRGILEQLIDLEVLVQRAEKDTTLKLDEAELNSVVETRMGQVKANFPSDKDYRAALSAAGFGTPEEYRQRQYDDLRKRQLQETYISTLRQKREFTVVNVSERDVTAELQRLGDQIPDRPATIGFQQIVLPTLPSADSKERARALADSIFRVLRDRPTEFEELAKKFSADGSAANGGDLGWNRRGVMVPEFDRVMFMLNPGVVSPPVETRFGWHVIRVDRVQPAEVKARHILITATMDSADGGRAHSLADSVRALWEKGTSFDSLRQRYHDERSGEDAIIPEVRTADLPEAYATAIGEQGKNAIVGPFALDDPATKSQKWVVLRLSRVQPAGPMTEEEARRVLRQNLQEAYSLRHLIDGLRDQAYISIRF